MTLKEYAERFSADLPAFAVILAKIATKTEILPLKLNRPQRLIHTALEGQLALLGLIRAIELKARQIGSTTYFAARNCHACLFAPRKRPVRAMIMAQDDGTATHIKGMYDLIWDHLPPALRIDRTRSNDHESEWANGSSVVAHTASTPTGKRGKTIDRLHSSESAYWPHADAHMAGTFSQIGSIPGTEIVLESTAAGASGDFYERWRSAQAGGKWLPIFIPWFEMEEYWTPPPPGFTLSHDKPNDLIVCEHEYAQRFGLDMGRMYWRRLLIEEKSQGGRDGSLIVAQEYPSSPDEAFLSGGEAAFISPAHVEAARKRNEPLVGFARNMPLVLGVDPATSHGQGVSCIVRRKARIAYGLKRMPGVDLDQLAQQVYEIAKAERAALVCVDTSEGTGIALVDRLSRMAGLGGKVHGVRFGDRAHSPLRYANRRAEIYDRMREWMRTATIPDEQPPPGQASLASELVSVRRRGMASEKLLQLEAKEHVIQRIGKSPDGADALACTFGVNEIEPSHGEVYVAPGPLSGIMLPEQPVTNPYSDPDTYVAPVERMF